MDSPAAPRQNPINKLSRGKFILLVGVLGWGVPTGILFALISAWGNLAEELPVRLAIALVLFPLGGILFGQMMWVASRKIQNKTTESKTTAS